MINIFINNNYNYIYNQNDLLIICSDIMSVLKNIKNQSIDLIFIDPPYNIGKNFGNNKDKYDKNEYLQFCYQWIDECMRILKDSGTVYIMAATQYMPYIDIYISEYYNVLCHIIWTYDSSGVQAKKIFGSLYEPILMCNKNKKFLYTFNADDILIEAKSGAVRKLINYRCNPPKPYNTKKVPGNVWNFNRVRFKMKEYQNHPTQKPEILLERIIKVSSNENDIILDPFAGSFTTLAVAKKLKRKCIGIDINNDYCIIGKNRLAGIDE